MAPCPETLLESELFGHARGAFTGASAHRRGLFEEADGGTLLLDEIGEMPPSAPGEAAARRCRAARSVPSAPRETITVDVRVVAATNRDIEQLMREGSFREDLYYRLNVIPVVLPPLRERREDVPLLAEHFLERAAQRAGRRLRPGPGRRGAAAPLSLARQRA